MAPCAALYRREPLACEQNRNRFHKKARIYQNMWGICEDRLPPVVEASRTLHETIARFRRNVGFAIVSAADVVATHFKTLAIQFGDPTLDDLPNRMRIKKRRDESDLNFFSGVRLLRHAGSRISRPDHMIDNGAI